MGYFATLAAAQQWAQLMRRAYPNAIATLVPKALLQQANSGVPTSRSADGPGRISAATTTQEWAAAEDESLTDTQVLRLLEARRVTSLQDNTVQRNSTQIALLGPEDTGTRRALKEAVIQGAPVSFAVQLQRSVQRIDLTGVPDLPIFQAFTLYATEGRSDGRCWHCLRLGFFSDAIAAKQVAYYVRPSFSAAAVVPVTDQECARANETLVDLSAKHPASAQTIKNSSIDAKAQDAKTQGAKPRPAGASRSGTESLEQTLELLAEREVWTDDDSLSETGVRHLRIEIRKGR
jgi:hypothetical protein